MEKIDEIRNLVSSLDSALSSISDSGMELEEAGSMLLSLNLLKRDISLVYDSFVAQYGQMMANESVVSLEGGAIIEKKSSYERKAWQHKDLARAVVDRLSQMSVDMDTGEVVKSPEEIAIDLMTYCAPSYWRVTELNKIGINPDMYCESGQLKTSIIVRKGENQ
jgi:hypothetical protein